MLKLTVRNNTVYFNRIRDAVAEASNAYFVSWGWKGCQFDVLCTFFCHTTSNKHPIQKRGALAAVFIIVLVSVFYRTLSKSIELSRRRRFINKSEKSSCDCAVSLVQFFLKKKTYLSAWHLKIIRRNQILFAGVVEWTSADRDWCSHEEQWKWSREGLCAAIRSIITSNHCPSRHLYNNLVIVLEKSLKQRKTIGIGMRSVSMLYDCRDSIGITLNQSR